MSERDDGGPAFPQQCADALDVGMVHAGMSLRDWFAGQALTGICAAGWQYEGNDHADLARDAYLQADAMLAVRAFGPRAVSAAESDALGRAATLLRDFHRLWEAGHHDAIRHMGDIAERARALLAELDGGQTR